MNKSFDMWQNDLSWLIDGPNDFEYKKYRLLAYVKGVNKEFRETKVHPHLKDLKVCHQNIKRLVETNENIYHSTKKLKAIDSDRRKFVYDSGEKSLGTLEKVLNFAEPVIQKKIVEGREIFNFAKSQCVVEQIGIMPLYKEEGLLIIPFNSDLMIFKFKAGLYRDTQDEFGITFNFLRYLKKYVWETYESIKNRLLRSTKELVNPPVFLLNPKIEMSLSQTLLPVARDYLNYYIRKN